MPITPYVDIDAILHILRSRIQQTLGEQLVGLYLYGSLVTGDFDHAISDIDLLAVTKDQIDGEAFERLDRMHTELVSGRALPRMVDADPQCAGLAYSLARARRS